MSNPSWTKLWRDARATRGRIVLMVAAIAVSIFGMGTILSAFTILSREINHNYILTQPASAFIELDRVDDELVKALRQRPDIADAEAGDWVKARVEVRPNEWLPLLLFVMSDFNHMRISTVKPESGAWPPPDQTLLVEREVLGLLQTQIGTVLSVQTPNGPKHHLTISGTVHDPALAPAWQEQTAYGYITPATLAGLGESPTLHVLKITVKDHPDNLAAVEATAASVAQWLRSQGYATQEIRIPPPLTHPHQSQMNAVLSLLLIFSVLALILSAILSASIIAGMLTQQVRQIGIMKAIGARARQIGSIYMVMVVLMGILAVALGLPPGILAGRAFAQLVAQLLNLSLYSTAVPVWVYLVLAMLGSLAPLLAALPPIMRAMRLTVRVAISDYGLSREPIKVAQAGGWLGRIRGIDSSLTLAIRNAFRRRGRLVLTLGLLTAAGAMFMAGVNVKAGWEGYLAAGAADRHYDLEVRLTKPQPESVLKNAVRDVAGVAQVEVWNVATAGLERSDGLNIVRTYPDGGHGSFSLRSSPPDSTLISTPMLQGRWLTTGDQRAVVLNQTAYALFPNAHIGDDIPLSLAGHPATFRLTGIVRQILSPATAYVSPETFAASTGLADHMANTIRIAVSDRDEAAVRASMRALEQRFASAGIGIQVTISEALLDGALSGHIYIFIVALIVIAAVMAVVGVLGLMSSMGTNVVERTREFGIMRTLGARSRLILQTVISEGVFIGLVSWVMSVIVTIPLSLGIGVVIGNLAFRSPLPLTVSPTGLGVWFMLILIGSVAASAYPASQAARLTIRETLAYI